MYTRAVCWDSVQWVWVLWMSERVRADELCNQHVYWSSESWDVLWRDVFEWVVWSGDGDGSVHECSVWRNVQWL